MAGYHNTSAISVKIWTVWELYERKAMLNKHKESFFAGEDIIEFEYISASLLYEML
jgi:hypothetical protein